MNIYNTTIVPRDPDDTTNYYVTPKQYVNLTNAGKIPSVWKCEHCHNFNLYIVDQGQRLWCGDNLCYVQYCAKFLCNCRCYLEIPKNGQGYKDEEELDKKYMEKEAHKEKVNNAGKK